MEIEDRILLAFHEESLKGDLDLLSINHNKLNMDEGEFNRGLGSLCEKNLISGLKIVKILNPYTPYNIFQLGDKRAFISNLGMERVKEILSR